MRITQTIGLRPYRRIRYIPSKQKSSLLVEATGAQIRDVASSRTHTSNRCLAKNEESCNSDHCLPSSQAQEPVTICARSKISSLSAETWRFLSCQWRRFQQRQPVQQCNSREDRRVDVAAAFRAALVKFRQRPTSEKLVELVILRKQLNAKFDSVQPVSQVS